MIEKFKEKLKEKVGGLTRKVTTDKRWDIQNQTMFDTFGLTLTGYAFGAGRNVLFLDGPYIVKVIVNELTNLGAGEKYVTGLVEFALSTFEVEINDYRNELVGIGYFHFASEDLEELIESIFNNTAIIQEQLEK